MISTKVLRPVCFPLLRPSSQCSRFYHSPNHPPSPTYSPLQDKILSTALTLVPSSGFTQQTLREAAKQSGYHEITHNLFPRGPWSIIEYHLETQREKLSSIPLEDGRIGKNIRTLCAARLEGNKEIIQRWREAIAVMSLPQNVAGSATELAKLVDEIWYLAGDRSVDFSYYTKRGLLSGVYVSTEMFMTTDESKDFHETWEFLDRRLADVQSLGKVSQNVSEYVSYTLSGLRNVVASQRGF